MADLARDMTSRYQILDGRLHHCGQIPRRMRADQRACIAGPYQRAIRFFRLARSGFGPGFGPGFGDG